MCGIMSLPVTGVFEDVTCVCGVTSLPVSGVFKDMTYL